MKDTRLYISHNSALYFWRTNPPKYVLEGADRDIRALRCCPSTAQEVKAFALSEAEFGPHPIDVLVPPEAPRPRSILRYHIQKAQLPRHSLYPLRDGIHIASPELCFVQLCKSLSFAKAAELGMELCGTYALREEMPDDGAKRDYQLAKASSLQRKANAWRELHGLRLARQVSPYLANGAASPMETVTYLLLCLPQQYGGYNLPQPELNPELKLDREEQFLLRTTSVKPDLLWRKQGFIIEYDGEYHNDPTQAAHDNKRRIVLETLGYHVETLKKQDVFDPIAFDGFAAMVAKRLGKRVRPLSLKQQYAREALRESLLVPLRNQRTPSGSTWDD